ncbi:MAG: DMT family transporter [Paracoccaceae bacterium]|jgi:drug/metabolite transporter (DMT)-like permease
MKIGVGLLIAAMALTPLTDGLSKSLVEDESAFFICFARYFCAGLVALLFSAIFNRPIEIPRHDRLGQVFRTGLMMGAMTSLIYALSIVPLVRAVGGFLIAPVVASLISALLYKEKMNRFRLIGALLSFAGAYGILRAEGSLELGSFMALLGGFLLGVYLAVTRHASACGDAFSTLVLQCFLGGVMLAPMAFWVGFPSLSVINLAYIVALGVVFAICHFLTIAAYTRTDASILEPFFYFNIVFAIPIGFFWFNEIPTQTTLIGLAGIIGGGIFVMVSARKQLGFRKAVFTVSRKLLPNFSLKI